MRQDSVVVPSDVAATPGRLPGVCAKHGRPVVRRVDCALQSRTRTSGSRALSGNVLSTGNRLAQRAEQVRITRVRGWPLCRTCAVRRAVLLSCSFVLFWGGLALLAFSLVVRLVVGHSASFLLGPALLGFGSPLLAVVPFVLGSIPRLTRARTSSGGASVVVEHPHPEFAGQLAGHE